MKKILLLAVLALGSCAKSIPTEPTNPIPDCYRDGLGTKYVIDEVTYRCSLGVCSNSRFNILNLCDSSITENITFNFSYIPNEGDTICL